MYYRLDDAHEIHACEDVTEWGRWFESTERHVAETHVAGYWVSTVFLGLDHGWNHGRPVLFETMTFGPDGGEFDCARYTTWADAEQGHRMTVAQIKRNRWRRPDLWAWRVLLRGYHRVRRFVRGMHWVLWAKAKAQARRDEREGFPGDKA